MKWWCVWFACVGADHALDLPVSSRCEAVLSGNYGLSLGEASLACGEMSIRRLDEVAANETGDDHEVGNHTDDHEEEHDEHKHHPRPWEAVIYMAFALSVGFVTQWFLTFYAPKVPYTMCLFVEGLLFAVIDEETSNSLGVLSRSIRAWERIDPELMLFAFLPILLFGDAFSLNVHIFEKKLWQCILLAGPGVILASLLTGVFAFFCMPYDWPWYLAMTFGSITAATDPVAVVSLLQQLGASPGLTMVITGESMFNDGTAMVLFSLFLSLAKGHRKYASASDEFPSETVTFFVRMALGGPAIGIAFGFAALACLKLSSYQFVDSEKTIQLLITLTTAYLSYYVADAVAHSSGVLSCVFAALVLARHGWVHIREEESMKTVWEMMGYIGNTLIFFLAGTICGSIVSKNYVGSSGDANWLGPYDFWVLIYTWVVLMVIRGVMIACVWPFIALIESHTAQFGGKRLEWRDAVIMTWGGLRGAVGLALAMVVEEEFSERGEEWEKRGQQVMFMVGGISLLTLTVNGATTELLMGALGMTETHMTTVRLREYAKGRVADACREEYALVVGAGGVRSGVEVNDADVRALVTVLDFHPSQQPRRLSDLATAPSSEEMRYLRQRSTSLQSVVPQVARTDAELFLMATLRTIYLRVLKSKYWEIVAGGYLPGRGLISTYLIDSIDVALDHTKEHLCDFTTLSVPLKATLKVPGSSPRASPFLLFELLDNLLTKVMEKLGPVRSHHKRHVDIIEQTAVYNTLFMFMHAHGEVRDETRRLFEELTAVEECHGLVQELDAEIDKQLTEARALMQLIPMSVQRETNSRVVAAFLLKKQHDEILKLKEESFISAKDSDALVEEVIEAHKQLDKMRDAPLKLFKSLGDLPGDDDDAPNDDAAGIILVPAAADFKGTVVGAKDELPA